MVYTLIVLNDSLSNLTFDKINVCLTFNMKKEDFIKLYNMKYTQA